MSIRRPRVAPETYELGALRLYREDLKTIAIAVQELGSITITCETRDGTYEATEPGDFDEIPEKLTALEIAAHKADGEGTIMATFGGLSAHITLEEPDTLIEGIRSRIVLICTPLHRRVWSFCRNAGPVIAVVGVLGVVGITIGYANSEHSKVWNGIWLNWIIPCFFEALIVIGIVMRIFGRGRGLIIINAPRAERPGYWQRTGDMWLVGVATAILGAIIGFVLGKIS
jgi:hypothetical protein